MLPESKNGDLRLLVRHGVVLKSCSFFSLGSRCTEETLSLGAQVFVDFWVFAVLVVAHLVEEGGRGQIFLEGFGGAPELKRWLALLPDCSGTCSGPEHPVLAWPGLRSLQRMAV